MARATVLRGGADTKARPPGGVHRSVRHLEAQIMEWIDIVNTDPKPFRWHCSAGQFLASRRCLCVRNAEAPSNGKTPVGSL